MVVLLSLAGDEIVVLENITSHSSYAPALERMRNIVEFEANISKVSNILLQSILFAFCDCNTGWTKICAIEMLPILLF